MQRVPLFTARKRCYQTSVLLFFSLFLLLSLYYTLLTQRPEEFLPAPPQTPNRNVILLWTTFFESQNWYMPNLSLANRCPEEACQLTRDRNLLKVSRAVVFHLVNVDLDDMPTSKSPSQLWVIYNLESPFHTPNDKLLALQNNIDFFITYRTDGPIPSLYGALKRRPAPLSPEKNAVKATKNGTVAWLVSNCHTPSHREEYVKELMKHIPVEIQGTCGYKKCSGASCLEDLGRQHYFYLAFENSLCKDYVTEKLFNTLKVDMIPVVFGSANYSSILPKNSYINALDFPTPKALASHLLILLGNKKLYRSYFEWKRFYELQDLRQRWVCKLCEQIRLGDRGAGFGRGPGKLWGDFYSWWTNGSACTTWGGVTT